MSFKNRPEGSLRRALPIYREVVRLEHSVSRRTAVPKQWRRRNALDRQSVSFCNTPLLVCCFLCWHKNSQLAFHHFSFHTYTETEAANWRFDHSRSLKGWENYNDHIPHITNKRTDWLGKKTTNRKTTQRSSTTRVEIQKKRRNIKIFLQARDLASASLKLVNLTTLPSSFFLSLKFLGIGASRGD